MVPIFMVSMVPKDKNIPKFKSFTLYRFNKLLKYAKIIVSSL